MAKGDPRSTALYAYLRRRVLADSDICWLCGQPGADTVDHVEPVSLNPRAALDPTNMRPAHGKRSPTCAGNYARGNHPPANHPKHSRDW